LATIMAAVGALLISSGIALMATPTSANADKPDHQLKDWVCKYVGTPGVDEHLKKGNDGLVWVSTHATQGTWFNDAHGRSYVLLANAPHKPRPSAEQCPSSEPGDLIAHAALNVVDPSCENGNTASFTVTADHAELLWVKVNGDKVEADLGAAVAVQPGDSIQAKVHADQHYKFDVGDDETAKNLTLTDTVGAVEVNCTAVTPVAPSFVEPTCTTAPSVQTPTSELVTYTVTGNTVAGGSVHVVAALVNSETSHFAEGATTTWDHTFTVPTGCTAVSPPTTAGTTEVSPPKAKAEATTPTVVHAGLVGDAATSGSGQAGLDLALGGLLLMAGAAGLVLVEGGRRTEKA
jgi:hypothetical protein